MGSNVYINPLAPTILAYFGMFFAMLFIFNFVATFRTIYIEHDELEYHSMNSASPFVSLIVLPLIAIAIIVGEFIAASYLGLEWWYVILAMAICSVIVILLHTLFKKSGLVGGMMSANVVQKMGDGKETFSKFIYNSCKEEVETLMNENGSQRFGGLSESESDMVIDEISYLAARSRGVPLQSAAIMYLGEEFSSQQEAFEQAFYEAKCGNIESQYIVALMYGIGRGTMADATNSVKYMDMAARSGHPSARRIMSECMMRFPKETKRALRK